MQIIDDPDEDETADIVSVFPHNEGESFEESKEDSIVEDSTGTDDTETGA